MVMRKTKTLTSKKPTVRKRIDAVVAKVIEKLVKKKDKVETVILKAEIIPEPIVATPAPPIVPPLVNKVLKLPAVAHFNPPLGCDPEFFFKLDGVVIGAEKVFEKNGLRNTVPSVNDLCVVQGTESKFIIDGVQAELNPRPNTCRANLANEISACFKTLKKELEKQGKGVSVDLSRSITLTEQELSSLDKENQKLGCMPSKSVYANAGVKLAEVDGTKHLQRSAGGHIHIGVESHNVGLKEMVAKDPDKVVQMLDLICGNTCVLIDRDEGNKERRKLYGRAGEYRLPKHGLEYRTLSNFWLESYHLMSFAFGTARLAIELVADKANNQKFIEAFLGSVNQVDVQKAINENDFDLALQNYKKIEPLIGQVTGQCPTEHFALNKSTLPAFEYFVHSAKEKGLKHYFKQDPITHWTTLPECHADGFHYFLTRTVQPEMQKVGKNGI